MNKKTAVIRFMGWFFINHEENVEIQNKSRFKVSQQL